MAASTGLSMEMGELLDTQGPSTLPLDAAAEYMLRRIDRVLPGYVLAMAPHAVVVAMLIDAITGERRADAQRYCLLLLLATFWRWIGLAILQRMVQRDLQMPTGASFIRRIPSIVLFRLVACVAITWGGLFVLPPFYGIFMGSFATPLLLENSEPAVTRLGRAVSWMQHSMNRLLRVLLAISVIAGLLCVAILINQMVLTRTLLPSLLNVGTDDLILTIESWPWRLGVFYVVFLLVDAYWTVASVFLYYDSQSRRMATDLRARLGSLTEESR